MTWVTCGNWLLSLALEWLALGFRESYKVRAPTGPLGASTPRLRVAVPPPPASQPSLAQSRWPVPRALPGLPAQDSRSCPVQPSVSASAPAPARTQRPCHPGHLVPTPDSPRASFSARVPLSGMVLPSAQDPKPQTGGVSLCFAPPSALTECCLALRRSAATSPPALALAATPLASPTQKVPPLGGIVHLSLGRQARVRL